MSMQPIPPFNPQMRQVLDPCTVAELVASLQQCPPDAIVSMEGAWPGIAIHVTMDNSAVSLATDPLDQIYDEFKEVL